MLTQDQIEKLLGRTLTTTETSNFKLYLNIAQQRLGDLLCMDLSLDGGERTYGSRNGYRSVYIDPFTSVNSVTVDGEEVSSENYTIKQNNNFSGSWYNIIEFDKVQTGKNIVVDANWGFDSCPHDLRLLLARLFTQGSVEQQAENNVKSKKIEDFTVTYKDSQTLDEWLIANKSIIDKYSLCNQGYIRHGRVRSIYNY